jgi:hypothetical protein
MAVLLTNGVSWGKTTQTTTSKTTTAKTTTAKKTTAPSKTKKPVPATPKTVVDYYLLLPGSYFDNPNASRAERKSWLYGETGMGSVVDIKNDYLEMAGDGAQGTIYMALFRHKGRVLVGTYWYGEGGGNFRLMRYENGKWRDVTRALLPVSYREDYHYIIPRYGTTIKVTQGNDEENYDESKPFYDFGKGPKIYDLVWVNGRFKVRRR